MPIHGAEPGHATIRGTKPRSTSTIVNRTPRPARELILTARDWMNDADCHGADPELFFAPDRERLDDRNEREAAAKAVCRPCPVRALCLEWALQNREEGYWAMTNDEQRRDMLKNERLLKRRLRKARGTSEPSRPGKTVERPAEPRTATVGGATLSTSVLGALRGTEAVPVGAAA